VHKGVDPMARERFRLRILAVGVTAALAMSPVSVRADNGCNATNIFWASLSGASTASGLCPSTGFYCIPPVSHEITYRVTPNPACDPTAGVCSIEAHVRWEFPGNAQNQNIGAVTPYIYWYSGATAPDCNPASDPGCGGAIGLCGVPGFSNTIVTDFVDTYIKVGSYSCQTMASLAGTYSQNAFSCATTSCQQRTPLNNIILSGAAAAGQIGCPVPPPDTCNEPSGGPSGAAGASCPYCKPTGGDAGCSTSLDGRLSCTPKGGGAGALLHYTAGGPGTAGLPGSSGTLPWQNRLGNSWSHDHAARIVIDNATEGIGHVWLISGYGAYREMKSLAAGSGLRLYQTNAPSDEYRQLFYDTASGGWQLKGLDGAVEFFRSDGQWSQTTRPSDPSHPMVGTYDGNAQLHARHLPRWPLRGLHLLLGGRQAAHDHREHRRRFPVAHLDLHLERRPPHRNRAS